MKNKTQILEYLKELFPDAVCELNFSNPYELLVSVILSAQCTDKRVNQTTPALFAKYPTVYDLAKANASDVENIIKPCGFYHNKAKNIINASRGIVENFSGQVPRTLDELMSLSGVGMKTAKVVCANLYNDDVIAVDTHVLRVSNRLGVVKEKNPNKVSKMLEQLFAGDISNLHHRMVLFGRYHCKSRNPHCEDCKLKNICAFYKTKNK